MKLEPRFICIPLGVDGGLNEGNLPAYLLACHGASDFICLDAGTLLAGLRIAFQKGAFSQLQLRKDDNLSPEGIIMHHHLKAYLITHPYLDHVEGLVVNSPNDAAKPVMGTEAVLHDIQQHLFNGRIWPNLCNTGAAPALGQYTYRVLKHGEPTPIQGTQMSVSAFPLAHGNSADSTAFLIECRGDYVLYMGDTGPDELEKRTTTAFLWHQMAPLIRSGKVRGIFVETSYPDERPDAMLFSHLTPAWLMHSFRKLADLVDSNSPKTALSGLNVIIIHIKPDITSHRPPHEIIRKQLLCHNDLGLNLLFAEQGKPIEL